VSELLLDKNTSALLLIDVQEKLTPLVLQAQALVEQCHWLIRLANDLAVPVLVTEQYPRGLGPTVEPLRSMPNCDARIEKVTFSCYREPTFVTAWQNLNKKQVVIAGIETHVCVLQTAMDMLNAGWDVFVVVDAVSSRHDINHNYALKRMAKAGIHLVTSEMVFFEWVGVAGTPEFKRLSKDFL
jgi:nicotinamidase-related amidase